MFFHGFTERTEDNPMFCQLFFERRHDGYTVKHGVHGNLRRAFNASEDFLLFQRNAELVVDLKDFRINFVERLRPFLLHRGSIVVKLVIFRLFIVHHRPFGFFQRQPALVSFQPPLQQPFRLFLLCGDETDHIFVQALRGEFLLNVGIEAIFILIRFECANALDRFGFDAVFYFDVSAHSHTYAANAFLRCLA